MGTRLLSASVMALLVTACATPQAEPGGPSPRAPAAGPPFAASDIAAGRAIAQANCATCHAIASSGDSPNPMSPPFRTLSASYPVESLAESFAEGVFVGHPVMPEFRLEQQAVDQLLAYLVSIQDRPARP